MFHVLCYVFEIGCKVCNLSQVLGFNMALHSNHEWDETRFRDETFSYREKEISQTYIPPY
jgi:hypothetical protein